jgi:hypothetical protein
MYGSPKTICAEGLFSKTVQFPTIRTRLTPFLFISIPGLQIALVFRRGHRGALPRDDGGHVQVGDGRRDPRPPGGHGSLQDQPELEDQGEADGRPVAGVLCQNALQVNQNSTDQALQSGFCQK